MPLSNEEKLLIDLRNIANSFEKKYIEDVANHILSDLRFPLWSGSSKPIQHHYGDGGLIQHTSEVVLLSLDMYDKFKDKYAMDKRIIFLSALFHDYGKVRDYKKISDLWVPTDHRRLIHHLSRSAIEWSEASDNLPIDIREGVLHVILSHHGNRNAGSPVAPKTREAWIVHLCDGISARLNDADTWDVVKGNE